MLFFIFAWEERIAYVKFIEDAAKGPHVYGCVVRNSEDDLGCTVEPRLDVGVDLLVFEAAAAKVDDLDARLVDLAQEDILGLQVAMDYIVFSHVVQ